MSASTVTPNHPTTARRIETAAEGTRKDITATFESIRSTAGDVGDRVPGLVDGVRNGAAAGAREIDRWPEQTRRLVAAASIGLGAGLAIAGAPRLVLGVALLPAIAVAATGMRPQRRQVRVTTRAPADPTFTAPRREPDDEAPHREEHHPCSTPHPSASPTPASTRRRSCARHAISPCLTRASSCGAWTCRPTSTPRSRPRRRPRAASSSGSPGSGGHVAGSRSWWPVSSVGVLAAVGVAAWLMRRRTAGIAARDRVEDREFDRDALDRAANEGMSIEPGKDDALSHSNGEVRELSAIGDLV